MWIMVIIGYRSSKCTFGANNKHRAHLSNAFTFTWGTIKKDQDDLKPFYFEVILIFPDKDISKTFETSVTAFSCSGNVPQNRLRFHFFHFRFIDFSPFCLLRLTKRSKDQPQPWRSRQGSSHRQRAPSCCTAPDRFLGVGTERTWIIITKDEMKK